MTVGSVGNRRLMLLCEGSLDVHNAKTATGLMLYCPNEVVAVIDRNNAGKTVAQVLRMPRDIPVVSTVGEAIALGGKQLVIGVVNAGGFLVPEYRPHLVEALKHGVDVINGLHQMLEADPELAPVAAASGAKIYDVRRVPDLPVGRNLARTLPNHRTLAVGTDCNVGKMCTALELTAEARRRGLDAVFAATGQTGVMIAGSGYCIDRAISDFASGVAERLIMERAEHDYIFIEGQGSIDHAMFSGVTLSLLHGTAPQALVLCHVYGRRSRRHEDGSSLMPLRELIELYETISRPVLPAKVVGVSLFSRGLDEAGARKELARITEETGLPATDTVRFGAGNLLDAILEFFRCK